MWHAGASSCCWGTSSPGPRSTAESKDRCVPFPFSHGTLTLPSKSTLSLSISPSSPNSLSPTFFSSSSLSPNSLSPNSHIRNAVTTLIRRVSGSPQAIMYVYLPRQLVGSYSTPDIPPFLPETKKNLFLISGFIPRVSCSLWVLSTLPMTPSALPRCFLDARNALEDSLAALSTLPRCFLDAPQRS